MNKLQADVFKEKGNKACKHKKYQEAVELYTKALDLYESAIYYTNRSFAKLKLGNPQDALNDANRAIKLDKDYTKSYNRRADAYFALGSYQCALEDYRKVDNVYPSGSSIKERIEECNKLLNQGDVYRNVCICTIF